MGLFTRKTNPERINEKEQEISSLVNDLHEAYCQMTHHLESCQTLLIRNPEDLGSLLSNGEEIQLLLNKCTGYLKMYQRLLEELDYLKK
ncbi:hypothetical protein HYU22_03020 [Candidatus Woesearchaeota archaeon]|nr:hypothetical protein [Candidatus Woesearchaeota archaeon]